MVHLRNRQIHSEPRLSAILRNSETPVVTNNHPITIKRINPNVVIVSAWSRPSPLHNARAPTVNRFHEWRSQEIRLVRIVGCHRAVIVIGGSATKIPVVGHELPSLRAIIRAPKFTAIRLFPMQRDAVTSLQKCVDTARVCRRQTNINFPQGTCRQAMPLKLRPAITCIARDEESASRSTTLPTPCVD